ncbi:MAG: hypothetical protein E6G41_02650 [Actinobacteria bacterium]|nr:MAG: hypothetical protein E6G41_02650 [Actinomycetota bacterium]
MKRIGLVVHPRRELDRALASVHAWAAAAGVAVVQVRMPGIDRVVADEGDAATCDVIVAMGGDGTTLAALHAGARVGKPVLGIACGSLGALTATSADHVDEALAAFAAGHWERRHLPAITVTAEGAGTFTAINDVVVLRNGASQITVSTWWASPATASSSRRRSAPARTRSPPAARSSRPGPMRSR